MWTRSARATMMLELDELELNKLLADGVKAMQASIAVRNRNRQGK